MDINGAAGGYNMNQEVWYVDIPSLECVNNPENGWIAAATFNNRADAIKYAQEHFGADETGSIGLVTGG